LWQEGEGGEEKTFGQDEPAFAKATAWHAGLTGWEEERGEGEFIATKSHEKSQKGRGRGKRGFEQKGAKDAKFERRKGKEELTASCLCNSIDMKP
jgi:hypothetical protein